MIKTVLYLTIMILLSGCVDIFSIFINPSLDDIKYEGATIAHYDNRSDVGIDTQRPDIFIERHPTVLGLRVYFSSDEKLKQKHYSLWNYRVFYGIGSASLDQVIIYPGLGIIAADGKDGRYAPSNQLSRNRDPSRFYYYQYIPVSHWKQKMWDDPVKETDYDLTAQPADISMQLQLITGITYPVRSNVFVVPKADVVRLLQGAKLPGR